MKSLLTLADPKGKVIADSIQTADSFFRRFMGLMFRPSLKCGQGLLLVPCTSIHMMFMRFPIDVIFLDRNNQVVQVYQNLPPWTGLSSWHQNASKAVEISAGTLTQFGIQPGDQLTFSERTLYDN